MAILGKLVDMDFKFVLPSIYINFDIPTNFEVNQTQIGHSIPKNTPKNHYNGHTSKLHFAQVSFTKKPTLPIFFKEFVCKFQNQCKYGFCTYYRLPIFDLGLQKNVEPKIHKNLCFFCILGSNFFVAPRPHMGSIARIDPKIPSNPSLKYFLPKW